MTAQTNFRFKPREFVGYSNITISKLVVYLTSLEKHSKHKVACRTAGVSPDRIDKLYEQGLKLHNDPTVQAHYNETHPATRADWSQAQFIDAIENPRNSTLSDDEREQLKAMWFAQQRETLPGRLQEKLLEKLVKLTEQDAEKTESATLVRARNEQIKNIRELLRNIGVESMGQEYMNRGGTTLNLHLGDRTYQAIAGRMADQGELEVPVEEVSTKKIRKTIDLDI